MSRNTVADATAGSFGNTWMRPSCSTTNSRSVPSVGCVRNNGFVNRSAGNATTACIGVGAGPTFGNASCAHGPWKARSPSTVPDILEPPEQPARKPGDDGCQRKTAIRLDHGDSPGGGCLRVSARSPKTSSGNPAEHAAPVRRSAATLSRAADAAAFTAPGSASPLRRAGRSGSGRSGRRARPAIHRRSGAARRSRGTLHSAHCRAPRRTRPPRDPARA